MSSNILINVNCRETVLLFVVINTSLLFLGNTINISSCCVIIIIYQIKVKNSNCYYNEFIQRYT